MDPKIYAIKEIIFGSNMQEYNEQFQELQNALHQQKEKSQTDIKELQKELKQYISDLEKELARSEARVKTLMNKETGLMQNRKADRKQLAKLFATMTEKLEKKRKAVFS